MNETRESIEEAGIDFFAALKRIHGCKDAKETEKEMFFINGLLRKTFSDKLWDGLFKVLNAASVKHVNGLARCKKIDDDLKRAIRTINKLGKDDL